MDRERFDAIAKLFADSRSRRRALGLLLGVGLLVPHSALLAGPGKRVGHSKCRGQGHLKDTGQGHDEGECKTDCPRDPRTGKPGFLCPDGSCSCGGKCCSDRCFWTGPQDNPTDEFCCTGKQTVCTISDNDGKEECATCRSKSDTGPCPCLDTTGLATSYRRP